MIYLLKIRFIFNAIKDHEIHIIFQSLQSILFTSIHIITIIFSFYLLKCDIHENVNTSFTIYKIVSHINPYFFGKNNKVCFVKIILFICVLHSTLDATILNKNIH